MSLTLHRPDDVDDRRKEPRTALSRPVKVRLCDTGRYLTGRTTNLSPGGALLEVDTPSLLVPGQRIALGVAWTDQQTLLHRDELIDATVLRSLGLGGRQNVAIYFEQRQQLALSA
ncbi:MAG: PilZ domain-containing protein [Phycisphaeraceae bacterium]